VETVWIAGVVLNQPHQMPPVSRLCAWGFGLQVEPLSFPCGQTAQRDAPFHVLSLRPSSQVLELVVRLSATVSLQWDMGL